MVYSPTKLLFVLSCSSCSSPKFDLLNCKNVRSLGPLKQEKLTMKSAPSVPHTRGALCNMALQICENVKVNENVAIATDNPTEPHMIVKVLEKPAAISMEAKILV